MRTGRIFIIAESIDVDDSSGSKANVALIKNLAKLNFEIIVYHYTRKQIHLENIECVAIKEKRRSFLFYLSRAERHLRYKFGWRLNRYIENILGFSFTLLNDRNSIVSFLRSVENTPDLVITLSKGGSFRPHHALLKIPSWHSKWLAYIHDPYPMHSYPRPYDWVEPGHQKKRSFFVEVSQKCTYAGYPSLLLAEWMESYYSDLNGKRLVIPHQLDEIKNEALPDFFKSDNFNIVHAGALMSARNPMALIEAFLEFIERNKDVRGHSHLILLGGESIYSEDIDIIAEKEPQLYRSKANLPYSVVRSIQKKASVNVILEAKGPISPFLPGKFPHCIHSNSAVLLLGPYYSESRRLLREDCFWSEINETKQILSHLEDIYLKWKNDKLHFDRACLKKYLSTSYLDKTIKSIIDSSESD